MKKLVSLLFTLLLLSLFCSVFAQDKESSENKNWTESEKNYIAGLNTNNVGIKHDCIFYLGKAKSQAAVDPLIDIVKDNYTFEPLRLVAAYALMEIGDPKGVKAVNEVAEKCDCKQVRMLCSFLRGDKDKTKFIEHASSENKEIVENNYLHGLKSNNIGIVKDCIYYLGLRKSKRAVEPLIDILNNKYTLQATRIMAAFSLLQIGDPEGIDAVADAIQNGGNESVAAVCSKFYDQAVYASR